MLWKLASGVTCMLTASRLSGMWWSARAYIHPSFPFSGTSGKEAKVGGCKYKCGKNRLEESQSRTLNPQLSNLNQTGWKNCPRSRILFTGLKEKMQGRFRAAKKKIFLWFCRLRKFMFVVVNFFYLTSMLPGLRQPGHFGDQTTENSFLGVGW